ncbi:MAG TPA: monovalent cation/H+ antiporter subunit D, partial [Tabrizicola sp.]|nr:monovalent cation/H+ antiporter subunit D [Tabrizicola sp.]
MAALYFAAAAALAGMPPLSGFVGKLLVLTAWSDHMLQVWPAVLITSLLMILGLARAGSILFWQPADPGAPQPNAPRDPMALAASFGLLAGIVALTVLAGPVHDWLRVAAEDLHNPWAYIEANRLGEGG